MNIKKLIVGAAALALILGAMTTSALARPSSCATINDGTITDVNGNPISLGYDQYGYNYQAHMFNGTYDSVDRNLSDNQGDGIYPGDASDPLNATYNDKLVMKWSDDWLSNTDCNGDGKLDRGVSGTSQGWLTNHAEGDYDSDFDGTPDAHYSYFVKIVWVGPGGTLWGQYQIIEQVLNDPAGGMVGLQNKIVAPGFGLNDQWTTLP